MLKRSLFFVAIQFVLLVVSNGNGAFAREIKIGVLAKRGHDVCSEQWDATAQYLTNNISEHTFKIIPLTFKEIYSAVEKQKIDLILANPAIYIFLDVKYGVSRIVTMKNKLGDKVTSYFGSVILSRKDRTDIKDYDDFVGKTFAAVDETSMGGWLMAWWEFKLHGINPYKKLKKISFLGTHDDVVFAVLNGLVDGGSVRTDTLERMAMENKINIADFNVMPKHLKDLEQSVVSPGKIKIQKNFPYLISTQLYPEWPIAKLKETSDELAAQVASALLRMPKNSPAARAAKIGGWTVSLSYHPVHQCLKDLRLGPYKGFGEISLWNFIKKYWYWNVLVLLGFCIMGWVIFYFVTLSRQLNLSRKMLVESKDKAESANKAKSTFLANMSHELRTPLNAIIGFSQLLMRDHSATSEQREQTNIIHKSGNILLHMINDILDLAKIEAGRIVLLEENFDLHKMLFSIEDMMRVNVARKKISFDLKLDDELPRYIRTDMGKLRQVLVNLIGNAVKFTDQGGIIVRVDTQPCPDNIKNEICLYCEIEDTGIGIDPEMLKEVFTPFVQADSSIDSVQGTGLGLAISKQFVEMLGGEIRVKSVIGTGSVFSFNINAKRIQGKDIFSKESKRVVGLASGQPEYKILVVEDVFENRMLLKKLLTQVGFQVREAQNGREALGEFAAWQPHLVWMDMRMPIMDGYEATRRLKKTKQGKATPIIGLTASVLEDQMEDVLKAGCDNFLRKPFEENDLFQMMATHLNVKYVYEKEPIQLKSSETEQMSIEELQQLSPNLIRELKDVVLTLEEEKIQVIITVIKKDYPALADKLSIMVEGYDYEKILNIIQRASK